MKYEEVYLKDYQTVAEAVSNLRDYFTFYNHERLHQALGYQTPAQVYTGKLDRLETPGVQRRDDEHCKERNEQHA